MTHFTKKIFLKIPSIITSIRSDDVIVTSLETTLSRITAGKDATIFYPVTRKLKRIVVFFAKQHERSKKKLTVERKSTSTN